MHPSVPQSWFGNSVLEVWFPRMQDRIYQRRTWRRNLAHCALQPGASQNSHKFICELFLRVRGSVLFMLPHAFLTLCVSSLCLVFSLGIPFLPVDEAWVSWEHGSMVYVEWNLRGLQSSDWRQQGPVWRTMSFLQGPVQSSSACPHSLLLWCFCL